MMGRGSKIVWPPVIIHESFEISTVTVHTLDKKKLRLGEVNLIARVVHLLSG